MKTEELVVIGGLALVAFLVLRQPSQPQVVYATQAQQSGGTDWVGQLMQNLLRSGSSGYQYTDPSAPHYVTPDGLTAG